MTTMQQAWPVYALLLDGSTVEIRPAGPGDFDAVNAMHEAMSPDNAYFRFFSLSPAAAEAEARRVCREPGQGRMALLALAGGEVVGCASYETVPGPDHSVEVAFAVADHMHHKGIATLLLEHLVSYAKSHQVTVFTGYTLAENIAMLKVFADAGLPVHRHTEDGVVDMTIPLPSDGAGTGLNGYLNAVAERERRADVASLRHVFAPESVAVIGASRRPGTVGRAIWDNIRGARYAGRLYPVNPHARLIGGVPCLASAADLPEHVDLAVIAVPPSAVLDAAEQCGRRGVRAVVVVTSGLDAAARADLLAACRRHGMRLIGPNCFGVAVPGIGLDATFAAAHPRAGVVGLVMQSGGLGFAVADQLSRLGIGISSFASVGDKLDVSSNDMLMWWEQDGVTRLAVLYIESFGNPRKFARTARRVATSMPVLTVEAGRSAAGQRAAASHTGAVATPLVTREALFAQAGVIVVPGFGDLAETAALLATQPVPSGSTVAIVSNIGGAGVLTADACTDLGLTVHRPHDHTRRRLGALIPDGGAADGPIDTTAAVSAAQFRECLELAAADEEVSAMIALVLPTGATGDLLAAIQQADIRVPLAVVLLDQNETVRLLPRPAKRNGPGGTGSGSPPCAERVGTSRVPVYSSPESAAAALARAARYGAWRAAPSGVVPEFSGIRSDDARALVREFLGSDGHQGWLPPDTTAALLRCYRIPVAELVPVRSEDDAVGAFAAGGSVPVVLKADVPGLAHKTDAGGVELDLRTEPDVRAAYRRLAERFGDKLRAVLVQPMIDDGTELIVGVADDHLFGPLVVFGFGGVATEMLADHAAHLTPLTDTDADTLIRSIKAAPLLLGYRGSPPADLEALRDLLLRVSRLADDLPEITDLDLNPVIARPDGVFVVDARVKATQYAPQDPFLRKLR
jgi:acyl-CoA synthetase (NDP forming)/GNAT superfamily N-acetyltransferase